jgi:hypothetical protein
MHLKLRINVITIISLQKISYILKALFTLCAYLPLFWLQQQDGQHILRSADAHHPDVSILDWTCIALGCLNTNHCNISRRPQSYNVTFQQVVYICLY